MPNCHLARKKLIEQTPELASKADEYTKIMRDQYLFAVNKSEKGIVDRCHNQYQLYLFTTSLI